MTIIFYFLGALFSAFMILFGLGAAVAGCAKESRYSTTDEIRADMRRQAPMPRDGRAEIDIHLHDKRRN